MKPLRTHKTSAFTLIELLVVLAIVAVLLTLAVPRYFSSVDRAKETVLVENLRTTRDAIDKFFSDTGRYPNALEELVQRSYLRAMPHDPVTDSANTWVLSPPEAAYKGRVRDLHSGAKGNAQDGRPYGSL
ncbi:prepilin-type N-terminal cleavage/methylation domain-containing protein [Ralstonia solanacearum]|uniref:type IV pilin protein n=1 Tax=Ralstonia solanacearum TaxID=305 RepID=UPI0001817272|nr:prepilin-type N-terminal cleavage/methylation domain-containing protein [Ralstonia solanacearum]MDC6180271.1 prepilin-type N-terminal cleavage/methylation domain-containing protein [Ralstonia solanacearum]MDC6212811.1 prepilin-type N-terminal cleavage/methylation domain-containing protein [Ralstonia solanacearum]MDC6241687.1 prepilin-type N-terminal cleavage/methylation domain-containing protein [Ralstonia solanacearum]MDD7803459.1 prepilin-type N-terminal cleavage/methylation domain-contain